MRYEPANSWQHPPKIKSEQLAKESALRLCKFKNGQRSARPQNTPKLRDPRRHSWQDCENRKQWLPGRSSPKQTANGAHRLRGIQPEPGVPWRRPFHGRGVAWDAQNLRQEIACPARTFLPHRRCFVVLERATGPPAQTSDLLCRNTDRAREYQVAPADRQSAGPRGAAKPCRTARKAGDSAGRNAARCG